MNPTKPPFPKDFPILDSASPTFAEDFAAALGLSPGDTLEIVGPQFERVDGRQVAAPPTTILEWAALSTKSAAELTELGLGIWEKSEYKVHWLYPGEWYNFIPNGFPVVSITNKVEVFVKGKTDDDIRYGCLAYGFNQFIYPPS